MTASGANVGAIAAGLATALGAGFTTRVVGGVLTIIRDTGTDVHAQR